MVPGGGFEPPRGYPHAPQACASAKFRHPGSAYGREPDRVIGRGETHYKEAQNWLQALELSNASARQTREVTLGRTHSGKPGLQGAPAPRGVLSDS